MNMAVMEQAARVRVICEPGARMALADDLAADVEMMLAHLPPPLPCRVDIGVPTRVRNFRPMHVSLASKSLPRPLASTASAQIRPGAPDLVRLSRDTLPDLAEALALGRIALAITWTGRAPQRMAPSDDQPQECADWTDRFLHLLTQRWTGDACACCT